MDRFPGFIYIFDPTTREYLTKKKIENLESYNKVKDLPNVTEVPPLSSLEGFIIVFASSEWVYQKNYL